MSLTLERMLRRQSRRYYTESELKVVLPGTVHAQKAVIKRAVSEGLLIRLKRGLYLVGDVITPQRPHPFELAQFIYGPSCISLESALSYHGLIPEAVYTTTSVTVKRSKTFQTPLGEYDFHKVPTQNFLIGVERVVVGDAIFFIATPWRALTDCMYCYKKNWNSLSDIEDDLRIASEDLPKIARPLSEDLKTYYHSKRINQFIYEY